MFRTTQVIGWFIFFQNKNDLFFTFFDLKSSVVWLISIKMIKYAIIMRSLSGEEEINVITPFETSSS